MTVAASTRTQDVAGLQSTGLVQSALLHELTGDSRTALVELTEAYNFASFSEFSFSHADAAGKLAMSYAMQGDLRKAAAWSEREAGASRPVGVLGPHVRCGGIVARAITAARSLQEHACAVALDELDHILSRDELWPFMAYARASYALVWGDSLHALDELAQSWVPSDLFPEAERQGGVAGPLLAAAMAELLLSLDRANQAQTVLDRVHQNHPLLSVARARLALLAGANERPSR